MNTRTPKNLEEIRHLVLGYLVDYNVKIYHVGAAAKAAVDNTAEVVIALQAIEELPPAVIPGLSEFLEESKVPYKVEIIDLTDVDYEFRDKVLSGAVLWKG